jgi:4-diphosphocytidyl-2-C-methyl-D-erythritol kinase
VADRVVISAPAKINLVLRVGARAADGFHPVASLMVALDGLEDRVTVEPAARRELHCGGGPDGPDNLAWRAADVIERAAGRDLPARISIDKRIPMQAGLGGGSSDAAAVLVALNRLFGLGLSSEALEGLGAELGSDVPFFVRGGTQWATGRGERLTPQPIPEDLWVVVCGPVAALSTAAVYTAYDRLGSAPILDADPPAGTWTTPGVVANDLWPAARALAPDLDAAAAELVAQGAVTALLCGSGGAIAGLWSSRGPAAAAADRIESAIALATPRPADGNR